jgi:hypothetical protein
MTEMIDAALNYASLGLPVFPCNCTDKSPLTGHGFYDATTDANQIKAWWLQFPDAMIGMPTGPASGIDVLDLDLDLVSACPWRTQWPETLTILRSTIPSLHKLSVINSRNVLLTCWRWRSVIASAIT